MLAVIAPCCVNAGRADNPMIMQPDGLELSGLQTAAGARVRKQPQRLDAKQLAEPTRKRARKAGRGVTGSTQKVTAAAYKRLETANESLKVENKELKARLLKGDRERR